MPRRARRERPLADRHHTGLHRRIPCISSGAVLVQKDCDTLELGLDVFRRPTVGLQTLAEGVYAGASMDSGANSRGKNASKGTRVVMCRTKDDHVVEAMNKL